MRVTLGIWSEYNVIIGKRRGKDDYINKRQTKQEHDEFLWYFLGFVKMTVLISKLSELQSVNNKDSAFYNASDRKYLSRLKSREARYSMQNSHDCNSFAKAPAENKEYILLF